MVDINERAKEVWIEKTTSRERIRTVLEETTEYATAAEIADRALTSEPTTRKYLKELVADGVGVTTQDGRTTRYKRNDGRQIDERIDELRATISREELIDGIREMKSQLQEYRNIYEVEGPEELAIELDAGADGWADVGRWRATRQNLAIAQAALQVDEAHRLAEA
ncbi:winged helix-turn-helix domain-containing protein [Halegenticoccus tardaugens]|uniref:winged helix-turn-helix domain-containing protein n=1 Tax=Halegenticoccus tardaugens TaxID=2071624 RepID=UPI00100BC5CB|nr:winged helix-turn-helix domain-containing protein [Halegenticoccus tardaugens]